MLQLDQKQIQEKLGFIEKYVKANNAAEGSKFDANANVTHKNLATLEAELMKDAIIQVNRAKVTEKIQALFGNELACEYIRQIEAHEIYVHDETSLKPYCASITMYPFLLDGLTKLGGESKAPRHLESFCGSFVNLVFAISAQFAGAIATVEFLIYFDHFARIDYGDDYLAQHPEKIANHLQHVVYALNQPAAARGYQSVFWNISIYDQYYFESMFGAFVFPPLDSGQKELVKPLWDNINQLQHFFMNWFNDERKKAILTFPVVTAAMLTENGQCKDLPFVQFCSQQLANGNSFFTYLSDNADSLASCCRLRNEMTDNTFSYTLGAGGISTGSVNVITMNINRLVQNKQDIAENVRKIHKYQIAYRQIMDEYQDQGMLPVYDAGFINLNKQFLTIGINGMVEAAESQGIQAGNNEEYKTFVRDHLKIIYDENKAAKHTTGYLFNTEFVPAENLGVKNAKWDKADGLAVNRDCYNSYFYVVEDENCHTLDKFILHGKDMIEYLDGGSALHLNLAESLSQTQYLQLFNIAAKTGCNYFCINVKITICNECETIDKRTVYQCPACNSRNVDHGTRVIGYLKRVSAFSHARQHEHDRRFYHTR
ncbi:anaerobic ribonucleoside-triphosphate reductase [Bermanella sp. WJH001]|uniref:anaerobic ribonucleoside-triphosphate reductase n=1 Tax=Bermanella sp. WJH001 TaxID=3048005 RepID=UPI0024BE3E50|nr:anaerobic ribonucleoside-triphosphate reductase [Bermanella sp. WJH001]MDJ1537994.1 anaerobic ribonucleoside-triphosphate reductase [Bermanella sp. WJH001]